MASPISVRCPCCQAKLKQPSKKLQGKKLRCPKCNTRIILRASAHKPAKPADPSSDTHHDIDGLAETQLMIPTSENRSSKMPKSDVFLIGFSGELAQLDEEPNAEHRARRNTYRDEDDDDGSAYQLFADALSTSQTPQAFAFDTDELDDDDDESCAALGRQMPIAAEATRDETDLMDALEGLAKQERSQPTRRPNKTAKHLPSKRKRR